MLDRIFPKQIDNNYRGHWLAIWIFVPIVLLKLAMAFNVTGLNPWVTSRFVIQNADGIPIDTFGAEAASVVAFLFAGWGLALLTLSLLGVIVLLRYRAMTPLMCLLLTIEQVGRKSIAYFSPIIRPAASDGVSFGALINWGLSAGLVIALILSLQNSRHSSQQHSQPV